MYHFKTQGEFIIKEEITLDIEKLKTIREELIENCSDIIHRKYESTRRLCSYDKKIRNYKETKLRSVEHNYLYSEPEELYLLEYDYLENPYLVSVIDHLLNGNINVIDELNNDQNFSSDDSIKIQEEALNNLIKINKIEKNLDREIVILSASLNKRKLINSYRVQILNCIKTKVVAILPIKEAENFLKFFDIKDNFQLEETAKKILIQKRKQN